MMSFKPGIIFILLSTFTDGLCNGENVANNLSHYRVLNTVHPAIPTVVRKKRQCQSLDLGAVYMFLYISNLSVEVKCKFYIKITFEFVPVFSMHFNN